jgi:DNA polymerase-1
MIYGWDIETHGVGTKRQVFSPHHEGALILTTAWADNTSLGYGGFVDWPGRKRDSWAVDEVNKILSSPDNVVVGHNLATFDAVWWRTLVWGKPIKAQLFDTRVAYALLDSEGTGNSLDNLARKYLGMSKGDMTSKRDKLIEQNPNDVLAYNIEDARLSRALYEPLMDELARRGMLDLMELCMESLPALVAMMVRGVWLDVPWVQERTAEMEAELSTVEAELNKSVAPLLEEFHRANETKMTKKLATAIAEGRADWPEVNWGSPKQLVSLLHKVLQFPVLERNRKSQAPKTDEETLRMHAASMEDGTPRKFLLKLLDYRELKKLTSTYLKPLVHDHLGKDGRVHTSYFMGRSYDKRAVGGSVSRLASAAPNLQNIPRDKRVKGAFVPGEGLRFFDADYAQIELRVGAWYAQEPAMLAAFDKGRDIHTAALAEIEGRQYEDVVELIETNAKWKEKRAQIKPVNFGVYYGVSPYRLTKILRQMGVDYNFAQAKRLIDRWFERYDRVRRWIEKEKQVMVDTKKVVTPTGRVRQLPDAAFGTGFGEAQLRQGINFLVQSLAFDVMTSALKHTERILRNRPAQVVMTVHDSLVGEYDPNAVNPELLDQWLYQGMVGNPLAELQQRFGIQGIPVAIDTNYELERWQ